MKNRRWKLALALTVILLLIVCLIVLCATRSQSLFLFSIVAVVLHLMVCGSFLYFTYGTWNQKQSSY
jgi:uncharacterized membrane protein YkgB